MTKIKMPKMPIEPIKPNAPRNPGEFVPDDIPKFVEEYLVLKTIANTKETYASFSIDDLISLKNEYPNKNLTIKLNVSTDTEWGYEEYFTDVYKGSTIELCEVVLKDNVNYNQLKTIQDKRKIRHERRLKKYKSDLEIYKTKLEKYNQEYKQYKEKLKQYHIDMAASIKA